MLQLKFFCNAQITVIIVFLTLSSCGITESDYIEYETPTAPSEPEVTCPEGLTSFELNLTAMISRCGTCHGVSGSTAFQKLNLSSTNDSNTNRSSLMGSAKFSSATAFFDFINSASHPGKSAVMANDQSSLNTWEQAEAACK